MGRATQGVRLIKVRDGDAIAAVAKVMHDDDEVVLNEDGTIIENNESIENTNDNNQEEE
jgi:DNA gyrase subunit A